MATAGGALAAPYLATWVMWRRAGEAATRAALQELAPVGEKPDHVRQLMERVRPFVV
ncbi:UNVERIFIED_ORG: hypothetical protein LHJ69_04750 [Shinella sp. XGS7]|nr:hypothetical protein [Shinella sp. XGS7]